MLHLTARELAASQQVHARFSHSRVGERWERIFRRHEQEIESIIAVRPDVRADLWAALLDLAAALVDEASVEVNVTKTASRALDDLERHGGIALRRDVQRLRDELTLARGRSLEQLLGG
jgi:hypothetical protein